jgi:hypothetical protein
LRELIRTNDPVVISLVEAVLAGEGIAFLVADQNMSVLDGSIGILPRRVLVPAQDIWRAQRVLRDAGLEDHLFTGNGMA